MQIRDDILQKNAKTDKILEGFVHLTHTSFNGIFPTVEDVVKYVNTFDNPEIAKLFLETGRYYHSAKNFICPICFPPTKIEKCPNCKQTLEMPSFLVLIMIISIMERLSSRLTPYQDFYTWMGTKETRRKVNAFTKTEDTKKTDVLIENLRNDWVKDYGSTTKITEFFSNFLTKEEKMEFVKSILYFVEVPELPPKKMGDIEEKPAKEMDEIFENWKETLEKEKSIRFQSDQDVLDYIERNGNKKAWEALPICFNEQNFIVCYSRDYDGQGQGYCHYNYLCRLDKDPKILDECFVQTVKTVYDWRSKFVHDMKIPPIRETAMLSDFYDGKSVIIELTTKELKPIFERMLKRYFDQFQKQGKPVK